VGVHTYRQTVRTSARCMYLSLLVYHTFVGEAKNSAST